MRTTLVIPLLCVLMLLAAGLYAEDAPQPRPTLTAETRSLRNALLAQRANLDLARLEYDSTWSAALERRLPAISKVEEAVVGRVVSVVNLDQHVYDWNKKCFLCRGATTKRIEEALFVDSLFIEAIQTPEFTHLIASAMPLGDSVVAVVCLVQRMVQFGICEETLTDFGVGSLTFRGYAVGYDWLRFVIYKGTENPEAYTGKQLISRAVSPDPSGHFEVTLPTGRFGLGEYRIAVYARLESSDEFLLAKLIPHRVE